MKEIIIYEYQLKEIIEALRLSENLLKDIDGADTCLGRMVRRSKQYANNALEDKRDERVKYG